jgi:hypothetical protein
MVANHEMSLWLVKRLAVGFDFQELDRLSTRL